MRANSQLIGIDNGQSGERKVIESKRHAVQRETVQPSPNLRARSGMDHGVVTVERNAAKQVTILSAVVKQDERARIKVVKIAN